MKTNPIKLTLKQEKYCQEYIKTGNKSEAYRLAYNAENMKPESINVKAVQTYNQDKIRLRIEELQEGVSERNNITIDECVSLLTSMARFDIAELFEENGKLKSIHEIPKEARLSIESLDSEEIKAAGITIGEVRKIKTSNRRANIIELMKHLGGYERDNKQQSSNIVLVKLPDNGRNNNN